MVKSTLASLCEARRFWQLCLGVLVLAVTYLALHPQPPQALTAGWDKLNHALAFAALAWSACLGFASSASRRRAVAAALLAFGALIELVQLVVPGRQGAWGDLLADAVGTAAGCALAMLLAAATRRASRTAPSA